MHRDAQLVHSSGQAPVRRDDRYPGPVGEVAEEFDEAIVPGVPTGAPGVRDLDTVVGASGQITEGSAVEHQGDPWPVVSREVLEPGQETARRAVAVPPPAVGSGADHVHAVDEDVLGPRCHGQTIARWGCRDVLAGLRRGGEPIVVGTPRRGVTW